MTDWSMFIIVLTQFQVKESLFLQNVLNAAKNIVMKEIQRLGKPLDDSRYFTECIKKCNLEKFWSLYFRIF